MNTAELPTADCPAPDEHKTPDSGVATSALATPATHPPTDTAAAPLEANQPCAIWRVPDGAAASALQSGADGSGPSGTRGAPASWDNYQANLDRFMSMASRLGPLTQLAGARRVAIVSGGRLQASLLPNTSLLCLRARNLPQPQLVSPSSFSSGSVCTRRRHRARSASAAAARRRNFVSFPGGRHRRRWRRFFRPRRLNWHQPGWSKPYVWRRRRWRGGLALVSQRPGHGRR